MSFLYCLLLSGRMRLRCPSSSSFVCLLNVICLQGLQPRITYHVHISFHLRLLSSLGLDNPNFLICCLKLLKLSPSSCSLLLFGPLMLDFKSLKVGELCHCSPFCGDLFLYECQFYDWLMRWSFFFVYESWHACKLYICNRWVTVLSEPLYWLIVHVGWWRIMKFVIDH